MGLYEIKTFCTETTTTSRVTLKPTERENYFAQLYSLHSGMIAKVDKEVKNIRLP